MVTDPIAFSIRDAKVSDAKALSAMMQRSWRESYTGLIEPGKLDEICGIWLGVRNFKERIADDNAVNILAMRQRQIIGHCYALPRENRSILIGYLYVLEDFQRSGIGKTLLSAVVDAVPDTAHIELNVLENNIAAIAFYKSLGFFEAGPEPKPFDEPASIKMTMAL